MSSEASYQLFVGIDIAAVSFTACWTRGRAQPARALTLSQTPEGYAALCQRLLATTLHQAGYAISVINPAQAHHFAKALLKRAKTDVIDAQTLAQLAALLQPAPWTPPPAVYYELQQRLAQRDALLDLQQQVRNQLHALEQLPAVIETVCQRFAQLLTTFATQLAS